jgi:hypothetical protein
MPNIMYTPFKKGLFDLLKNCSPDDLAIFEIYSETSFGYSKRQYQLLGNSGINIPEERKFLYTPPGNVSRNELKQRTRIEVIPYIDDTSLTFLIIDDCFSNGYTLSAAVKALKDKSIPISKLYYFGIEGTDPFMYLDHVSKFLSTWQLDEI